MKKYVFHVNIKGLKEKIYRYIEIREECTLNDLGVVILGTFNSLAKHDFKIVCDGNTYNFKTSNDIKLNSLKLNFGDELTMVYNESKPTTFEIRLIEINDDFGFNIIYGEGSGMLENVSSNELCEIVKRIDKDGKSDITYSDDYFNDEDFNMYLDDYYDYNEYSLEDDIDSINDKYLKIKDRLK